MNGILLQGQHHREAPVFKVFAELLIPNVTIQPGTDEVQIYLNRAVQTIVSVAKTISQWDKDRPRVSENDAGLHNRRSSVCCFHFRRANEMRSQRHHWKCS